MERRDHARPLTIGIVGAGIMGRGIAQIAAEAGLTVLLADARPEACAEAKAFCADMFARKAAKNQLSAAAAEQASGRILGTAAGPVVGYAELSGCALVIEAVAERMEVKHAVLAGLEEAIGPDCIIATNTSSLSVTAIAAHARHPERVAGFHFFNPVPLMKVVEVIGGLLTAERVLDDLSALARRMGHHPIRATDTPGFIVNHAGRAYGTEALRIASEGIAGFADIDRILVEAAGFRLGPFELFDLTGLDVSHVVIESIYHQYYEEPRLRPVTVTAQRHAAGLFGRKNGRGFYTYENGKALKPPEAPAPDLALNGRRVWISRKHEGAQAALSRIAVAAGVEVEAAEDPSAEALILVTPLGEDCTTAALAEGLDPARTVAVDCLLPLERRRTLMRNPATTDETSRAAEALFAANGTPVTLIADSPGFVAQRVIACIVNVAAEMAQLGVASPEDINRGVELGLGYPRGSLRFGDELGPARILSILDAMHRFYGDPRYRASPWLKRRAMLGLPLSSLRAP